MSDLNEQSFSAGKSATGRPSRRVGAQPASPTWRFRPVPGAVVETFRARIIPKIVLALRSLPVVVAPGPAGKAGHHAIPAFAELAIGVDDNAAFAYVEQLLAAGSSVETILLDVLAPAARHLGELWENDAEDFVTVTLGVSRLHRIMRRLGDSFFNEGHAAGSGESVLLSIIPGEQHSFGLSMVAEFFRRAGWNLCTGPFDSHQELLSLVQYHWFDVVGFSVSSDRRLKELKQDIGAIRRDSRNRRVGIMLGGPMILMQPDLMASLGADLLSVDAAAAPQQAHDLIQRMTQAA